jgi:hypothetical protein
MPLLRRLCSLLSVLALLLATMVPVSQGAMPRGMHGMAVSAVEDPMAADCDRCDGPAAPMACAKVFCAGSAVILTVAEASPEPASAKFGRAPDEPGSGLSRFPEPHPPRTILIG